MHFPQQGHEVTNFPCLFCRSEINDAEELAAWGCTSCHAAILPFINSVVTEREPDQH